MLPFKLRFYLNKYKPRQLLRYFTPRRIILAALALLFAVSVFLFIRQSRKPTAARTAFADAEEIVVGIAAPSAFAGIDENGNITGYERDVASAVLDDIYPGKILTFLPITSQEASYLLKNGEIDVALGMYVSGPLKTQGLSLSNAYFTDGVYAFCNAQSTIDNLWALTNQRVRVLSSDITKSAVASMFKELEITVDLHLCSSYPDGLLSLESGDCAALIAPRYKLESFEDLRRIEEPVGVASYRFMLWTENSDLTQLINTTLSRLRANGTLAELQSKWHIEEYKAP